MINYGGDILKYAGDAIFAEWQVCDGSDAKEKSRSQYRREKVCGARNLLTSLQGCVSVAAQCGAKIVATCSHYPVFAQVTSPGADLKQGAQVGTLNVHCGLGAGEVAAVHVGDDSRRELLLIGDPIDQVIACAIASHNGVSQPYSALRDETFAVVSPAVTTN